MCTRSAAYRGDMGAKVPEVKLKPVQEKGRFVAGLATAGLPLSHSYETQIPLHRRLEMGVER